jgi:acetyl-CoA carboxylase/biotin carboxylase 1
MEMYADEEARAGVLEPEGIIGIKYKKEKQQLTMERLDPTYAELKRRLADKDASLQQQSKIKAALNEREQLLRPVYTQIALQFADLHDRAERMAAKGTIRMPLQWRNARRFFHWRLRRRLAEEALLKSMERAAGANPPPEAQNRAARLALLRAWSGVAKYDVDDAAVARWAETGAKDVAKRVELLRREGVRQDVLALMRGDRLAVLEALKMSVDMMPVEEKEKVLRMLASKGP